MSHPTQEIRETDLARALRGPRTSSRAAAHPADFAPTTRTLDPWDRAPLEFTPTRIPGPEAQASVVAAKPVARSPGLQTARSQAAAMLSDWETARWVEEQEARAAAAARRAAGQRGQRGPASFFAGRRGRLVQPHAGWLPRIEAVLNRLLPPGFGSLLGLFLCVSLSMVLISSMLPIVDRI
jgi:hypothetical protein